MYKSLLHSKILQQATKVAIGVVLAATFISPLGGLLPVAHAQKPAPLPAGTDTGDTGGAAKDATTGAGATDTGGWSNPSSGSDPSSGSALSAFDSCTNSKTLSICLSNIIYALFTFPMSMFTYITSFVFDIGVQVTLNSVTYSQDFITVGWTTVRDIANMAFIFMLIYLAIIIVTRADTANTMKMLASIIIVALLINFSFFISRLAIDGGNLLAIQFYNAINVQPLATTASQTDASTATSVAGAITPAGLASTKDLTYNIMQLIGVQTLLGSGSFALAFQKQNNFVVNLATFSFIYIIVAIILAILAFMFLATGIKFLLRSVMLWLLIMASPLAFVAAALPDSKGGKDLFKKWYTNLFEYAFFPAVFLFLYLIVNMFAAGLGQTNNSKGGLLNSAFGSLTQTASGVSVSQTMLALGEVIASISIRLGLLVLFLGLAVKLADDTMKAGGGTFQKINGWAANKVSNTAGMYGRNTFGRAGYRFANSNIGKRWASHDMVGRTLYRGADKLGRSTYDVRGVTAFSKAADAAGARVGGPDKKNFGSVVKEKVDQKVAYANSLKPNEAQMERLYTQELEKADKKDAIAAYKKWQEEEEKYKNKPGSDDKEVKRAKSKYDAEIKKLESGVKKEVKASVQDRLDRYADTIETRRIGNIGGILSSGLPGFIGAEDRVAAAKIRGRSTDAKSRLEDAVETAAKDATVTGSTSTGEGTGGTTPPATPPTTARPPTSPGGQPPAFVPPNYPPAFIPPGVRSPKAAPVPIKPLPQPPAPKNPGGSSGGGGGTPTGGGGGQQQEAAAQSGGATSTNRRSIPLAANNNTSPAAAPAVTNQSIGNPASWTHDAGSTTPVTSAANPSIVMTTTSPTVITQSTNPAAQTHLNELHNDLVTHPNTAGAHVGISADSSVQIKKVNDEILRDHVTGVEQRVLENDVEAAKTNKEVLERQVEEIKNVGQAVERVNETTQGLTTAQRAGTKEIKSSLGDIHQALRSGGRISDVTAAVESSRLNFVNGGAGAAQSSAKGANTYYKPGASNQNNAATAPRPAAAQQNPVPAQVKKVVPFPTPQTKNSEVPANDNQTGLQKTG